MGLTDFLKFGKKDEKTEEKKSSESKEAAEQETEESVEDSKYSDKACAFCGRDQVEKQWAGQYWHKKCFRMVKKGAKRMI